MDSVDRIIIERLKTNCRTSPQDLSRLTRTSVNALKTRIDHLVERGIIESFIIILSPLITNEDIVIAILEFATEQDESRLLKILSNNHSVHKVSKLLDGRYIVQGVYFEQDELLLLIRHLQELPDIRNVELHFRFIHYWGGKMDLTSLHRDILRCLVENPRMSISDIAKKTGLLSNVVKDAIDHMISSEAVLFTIKTSDEIDSNSIEVLAKVQWNVGKTSKEEVLAWLQEQFGALWLGECVSATEPTLFFHFSVSHVQEVEIVVKKTREFGLVTTIEPMILFPGISFPDPRENRARILLQETGFSSQNGPFK